MSDADRLIEQIRAGTHIGRITDGAYRDGRLRDGIIAYGDRFVQCAFSRDDGFEGWQLEMDVWLLTEADIRAARRGRIALEEGVPEAARAELNALMDRALALEARLRRQNVWFPIVTEDDGSGLFIVIDARAGWLRITVDPDGSIDPIPGTADYGETLDALRRDPSAEARVAPLPASVATRLHAAGSLAADARSRLRAGTHSFRGIREDEDQFWSNDSPTPLAEHHVLGMLFLAAFHEGAAELNPRVPGDIRPATQVQPSEAHRVLSMSNGGAHFDTAAERLAFEWDARPEMDQRTLSQVVAALLDNPSTHVRSGAVRFFQLCPDAHGHGALDAALREARDGGGGYTDVDDPSAGATADLRGELGRALAMRMNPANLFATIRCRSELVEPGRAAPLVAEMVRRDRTWVEKNVDAILETNPDVADLVRFFIAQPREPAEPSEALMKRTFATLARYDAPHFERNITAYVRHECGSRDGGIGRVALGGPTAASRPSQDARHHPSRLTAPGTPSGGTERRAATSLGGPPGPAALIARVCARCWSGQERFQ